MTPSRLRLASLFAPLFLLVVTPCPAGIGSAPVSSEVKRAVEVVYAVVPRLALPEAVKGPDAALAEEAKFAATNAGAASVHDLSVVVFVKNGSKTSPLFGRLKVFIPDPIEIEIFSMSTHDYSIFVVDTGGVSYAPSSFRKHHEWLTLKARL